MDRLAKLVAGLVLALVGVAAHAGYAYPADPIGFSRGGPWGPGFGYAPAANDSLISKVIHQANGLKVPVPGKPVTMPVAYRLSANAPRIAAAAIFLHPGVRTAVGIASWLMAAKIVWDEASKTWKDLDAPDDGYNISDGYQWRAFNSYWPEPKQKIFDTREQACDTLLPYMNKGDNSWVYYLFNIVRESDSWYKCHFRARWHSDAPGTYRTTAMVDLSRVSGNCPAGWIITPAGCVQTPPPVEIGTKEQFVEKLVPKPMPDTVPQELPRPTPLPVEPTPVINPEPGPDPRPRPMFVPTGDPVPNPHYNPNGEPSPDNQPWIQPGVRINPSPTPSDPWRVDLQPVNRPRENPTPTPGPESEPVPQPGQNPNGDKSRPEDQADLCEKNPDILACQKLDKPEDEELPESEKPISIVPDAGWGASNAQCPAPRHIYVQGRDIPIPFDLFCTYMSGMRPIIIAMAWLSAAFILIGARGGD